MKILSWKFSGPGLEKVYASAHISLVTQVHLMARKAGKCSSAPTPVPRKKKQVVLTAHCFGTWSDLFELSVPQFPQLAIMGWWES